MNDVPHVQPPRDADGKVLPHDHEEILDAHFVLRHIHPNDIVPDSDGTRRVASGAYSASSGINGGMSIDILDWMAEAGLDELHYVRDPAHGGKRINVGELRCAGFKVGWDPYTENPYHGEVWGNFNGSKNKRKIAGLAATVRKAQGES